MYSTSVQVSLSEPNTESVMDRQMNRKKDGWKVIPMSQLTNNIWADGWNHEQYAPWSRFITNLRDPVSKPCLPAHWRIGKYKFQVTKYLFLYHNEQFQFQSKLLKARSICHNLNFYEQRNVYLAMWVNSGLYLSI